MTASTTSTTSTAPACVQTASAQTAAAQAAIAALDLAAAPSDTDRARVLEALLHYAQATHNDALAEAARQAMPAAHPFRPPPAWRERYLDAFRATADSERGVDPDADCERCCGEYWRDILTDAQRAQRLARPEMGADDGARDAQQLNEA
jgi:hypothetical protein